MTLYSDTMNPMELFDAVETALALAGMPHYCSADTPGQVEVLSFCPPTADEEATWALVPEGDDKSEFIPVDAAMARDLLLSHFRQWLLERGWQVQVRCSSGGRRWDLVDCLAAIDGGGDRLDVDYPYGDDELNVLVQSIIAVHTI